VERYRLLDYEATKAEQEPSGKENFRFPPDVAEGWVPDPSYMGKGLQLRFTVEDEGAFTTPWSATITYRRPPLTEWREYICAENRQEYYRVQGEERRDCLPRTSRISEAQKQYTEYPSAQAIGGLLGNQRSWRWNKTPVLPAIQLSLSDPWPPIVSHHLVSGSGQIAHLNRS
jgi:hypothetical protein